MNNVIIVALFFMVQKLFDKPDSYNEVWAIRPKGIYKYRWSRQYKIVRSIPAILWVVWWMFVGPLIFHIRPLGSIYSATLPMTLAVLLSILIDYLYYRVTKSETNPNKSHEL